MKVNVELFSSLRLGRFKAEVQEYPPAIRIRQVVQVLGVPDKAVGIVLLNGQHVSLDSFLNDGDRLSLFPLIGGG